MFPLQKGSSFIKEPNFKLIWWKNNSDTMVVAEKNITSNCFSATARF